MVDRVDSLVDFVGVVVQSACVDKQWFLSSQASTTRLITSETSQQYRRPPLLITALPRR